jgi:hypothetical protein
MSTRRIVLAVMFALVGLVTSAPTADAFGDRCCPEVRVRGEVRGTMREAMQSAIEAWERQVQRQRGTAFADWYYSGDRQIDCGWDVSGRRIRCSAVALPCGREGRARRRA